MNNSVDNNPYRDYGGWQMKISFLIRLLEIVKDKYGDQDVFVPYRDIEDGYQETTLACMNSKSSVYDRMGNKTIKYGVIIF